MYQSWRNGQKINDFLARKCIYQYLNNIYQSWRNGQKRNDFLARKCIYQYLNNNVLINGEMGKK